MKSKQQREERRIEIRRNETLFVDEYVTMEGIVRTPFDYSSANNGLANQPQNNSPFNNSSKIR